MESTMLETMRDKNAAATVLQGMIDRGKASAATVVEHVMTNQPIDRILTGGATTFTPTDTGVSVEFTQGDGSVVQKIHRNALGQMATTTDLPLKFIDSLTEQKEPWGRELLAHNLQTVFHRRFGTKRFLVRSLHDEARGFLSDHYRRIDSRPVVEAFVSGVMAKGAKPYAGHVTDTRIALQAVMPDIYEPIPGEMMAYGISLENSDFGAGALSIRAYLLRIWCSNLMVTNETMRQVHLGKRLDDSVLYSTRTYQLDAETTVSALKDVVATQFDADSLRRGMEAIKLANATEISSGTAHERLRKLLSKGEAEKAIAAYDSPDVYNLPAGHTVWRMSNAISWIGGQTEDTERKLDLMKVAGSVLPTGTTPTPISQQRLVA